ncbi:NADPH-dependent FMN reductase [Pseudogemmobacter sonorensis]|uniref:NADPH-dependent FMN reductase n=1 Tax=Pseudogemmobacter sonorensis TaxID=2989681 RepID=UPI00369C16D5
MSKFKIVALSSSLSNPSKTAMLTQSVVGQLEAEGFELSVVNLRDIPPEAFFAYPVEHPEMVKAFAAIEAADGIVIATPIYKSSFSGLLKCFLDLLPQFAFAGKAILPLATGGSLAHVLALDYSLRPVLQSMGARHIVQGHFLAEKDLLTDGGVVTLEAAAQRGVSEAVHHFKVSVASATGDRWLGHPRPERAPNP